MRKGIIILSFLAITALLFIASASMSGESKIAPLVFALAGEDGKIPVIIVLKEQPQINQFKGMMNRAEEINNLKSQAESSQRTLVEALRQEEGAGNAKDIKSFYVVNAIAVKATPLTIKKLAQRSDVDRIEPDVRVKAAGENPFESLINRPPLKEEKPRTKDIIRDYTPQYPNNTAWGVNWIEAPQLWERGINGSGVNVSIIDTGIYPHPDIAGKIIAFKDFVKTVAYNGSNAWWSGKGDNLTNTLERNFSLGHTTPITFEFYGKYDFDYGYNASTGFIYYDYGYLNISTNNGATWNTLKKFQGLSDGYLKESFDLSAYHGQIVRIQFAYYTDESISENGWYVDDVKLKEGPTTTFFDGAEAVSVWDVNGWSIKDLDVLWPTGSMFNSGSGNNIINTLERTFNFSTAGTVTLNFTTRYYAETNYDYGYVQVSTNDGSTWTNLAIYNGYSSTRNISLNLNSYAGMSDVRLRFLYDTDGSVNYEGWYVDEISIPQISFYDNCESLSGWTVLGWKVIGEDTPYDDQGHGTHVAGTVAGTGKMGINTGVAPGANLFGAKVLDSSGSGFSSDIIKAVEWSAEKGAGVVSLSLGMLPWDVKSNYYYNVVNASATNVENISVYSNAFVGSPFNTITPTAFKPTFIIGGIEAFTGNNVWKPNATGATLMGRFNLSSVASANLSFNTSYDIYYGSGLVQASSDGSNWTNIASFSGYSPLISQRLNISSYAGGNVTIRFLFSGYGDWRIDDISIPDIPFYDDVEAGNTGWDAINWQIYSYYAPVNINNLNVSLISPSGVTVSGEPVGWMYDGSGELPSNVWLYKFVGANPLEAGTWNLSIKSNTGKPVYYWYVLVAGYPSDGSDATSMALNKAADMGVVPVVAAGNDGFLGRYSIGSPGASSKAITVGATDYFRDYISAFSSRGPVGFGADKIIKPDVVAPGVYIPSLDIGNYYTWNSGTSMATPHVAGAVALMLQRNSSLNPADVKRILEQSAIDLGTPGKDEDYGSGRISAYAAAANASLSPLPPVIPKTRLSNYELFAGATIDNVFVNPFISDGTGDVANAEVDIKGVSASSYLYGSTSDYVSFNLYTNAPVNRSVDYKLYLDTDKNASTGYSINDIGADYQILINSTNGYLYRVNGSALEFVSYLSVGNGYNYITLNYLYLYYINQNASTLGFYGVAKAVSGAVSDTAPDTGHGTYPSANVTIRMVGISWNDATGAPQAGTNITFRLQKYQGYPYYNYITLFNSTKLTNDSGMAVEDVNITASGTYDYYYANILDDRGNEIWDSVYLNTLSFYVPEPYRPPFSVKKYNDYYATKNSTLPVKFTLVTPDWQPYNANVTLVFGYIGSNNVSAELTPVEGTIEYNLDLSATNLDEIYYDYYNIPVRILNGNLTHYNFSYYSSINIVDRNYSTVKLNPDVRAASVGEKVNFLTTTMNMQLDMPVSRKLSGEAYWIREVDVKALGEKVSPSVLVKLDEMRNQLIKGESKNLLTKEEEKELIDALPGLKNIGINASFFDVFTDATGVAMFNVTPPKQAYYGIIYVSGGGYYGASSFVFVKDPNWNFHPKAPSIEIPYKYMNVYVNWNANKTGDKWVADSFFDVFVNIWECTSTGCRGAPNEKVYLYTTTRDTKNITTDANGTARTNFTAPKIDIRNSTDAERQVQVWGIVNNLKADGSAVADDGWGYLNIPTEYDYNQTPITMQLNNNTMNVLVTYLNRSGSPTTNVPSIVDIYQSPGSYWWYSSADDLHSRYVKSPTGSYVRSQNLSEYGTYRTRVSSNYSYKSIWDLDWQCSGCWLTYYSAMTYHPFNITSQIQQIYPMNFTQPIPVSVMDVNGTPMPGVSVYLIEDGRYYGGYYYGDGYGYGMETEPGYGGGSGGGGSGIPWGHVDLAKTDANGQATLILRTPPRETIPIEIVQLSLTSSQPIFVRYRIGGATDNFSMPYIKSGSFRLRTQENKSDLMPVFDYLPSTIEANQSINITGKVWNYGDVASNASVLRLFVGGEILGNLTIPVIQPNNYSAFSRTWTLGSGTHSITAQADATNTNDEGAGEANNYASTSVIASLPDLRPTIIAPAALQLGGTADIEVRVSNIGGITAPASTLLVQINNANFNTSAVPSIPAGGMYSAHISWTPTPIGNYVIRAVSDSAGIISELNELNNETTQAVNVFTLPDLTVTLTVPSEVRVNTSANIRARVSNLGSSPSNNTTLSIYEGATLLQNVSVPQLNASESRDYNVAWTPLTTGTRQIRVIIDPDDTTKESNEANNVDIKASSARFTDLAVTIQSRNEVILNSTETIRVVVRNIGTMASEPTNLTTTINSTLTELINTTVPSIAPGDSRVFSAIWNANETGLHRVTAVLESRSSDTNPANDNATRVISVKGYNINVWYMWYPSGYPVYEENTFYIGAYVDADYAGTANASISFEPASGLNATMPNKTFTLYNSTYNYVWWQVRADQLGKYNVTITVSGFNETSEINTTQNKVSQIRYWDGLYNYTFYQNGPINIIAQTVVVKDLNWTIPPLDPNTNGTLSYQVFNVTEIEKPSIYYWIPAEPNRSLKIDLSAGAEGRLLIGLEYLFGYPHGCPEQTMSPTLGAKRVEQYYLKRGVLTASLNATLYDKVKTGVNRMSPNSTSNPQQIPGVGTGTGGWAWGTGAPSMFYTVYTHYGMGVILNNTNYSHLVYNANINVNESARWITNNQNIDGSWTGSGYISGNVPFTGFTMIALEQTLPYMNATMYNRTNNSLQNATAYLLRKQMSNGGWNQSYGQEDAYSTSLTLLGLIDSGNNSAPVQQAISNGTVWLIANQDNRTGSWSKYGGSQSWSHYGDLAETTAYAAVALNKSGNNSAAVINASQNGLSYLVGVYQDQGSWGSTKSSMTAIYALTELQVPEDIDTNVTIVLKDVIYGPIRLNNSNPAATISSLPKPYLIRDRLWIQITRSELNAIGIGNLTINITNNGSAKVLVGVESKQNAHKIEAFEKVPWRYIDPIADNFTLAMSLPSGIEDGQTVTANATITNKDNNTGLYVMVLEVPLSSNVTFPNTYPDNTTYYNNSGTKVLVQNMYNASVNKLYIYPGSDNESQPSVPANASRSFYFNVTMLGYGQQTIESKVVPMYNDTLMAIAIVNTTVKGYGNVTVNTTDVNDSSIAANVVIDSSKGTTVRKLEGNYSLNATKAGFIPVNTTVSIAPGSDRIYTAKLVENASDPVAVFYETNTTALPANVSGVVTKVYNFTVQSNGGKTIIALQTPANHTFLSAAVNGVNASARNESGIVYVEAELTGDSVFEVRFKAPRMFGDVNDDNTINAIDVAKIKRMIVGLDALDPIADFNEDGAVNAIDVAKMKRYIVGLP